jgi:drug/metabolite transporter (DMT)-like permease
MLYFILGVLCTSSIFLLFKAFSHFRITTFPAIIVNYLVCVLTGLLFLGEDLHVLRELSWQTPWLPMALGLGVMFIGTFYLMSVAAQEVSVAASSIATKISLLIPVLFSWLLFQPESWAAVNFWNLLGFVCVFVAILLTSNSGQKLPGQGLPAWQGLLLLSTVFVMSGLIDTSLNYLNIYHLHSATLQALLPVLIFSVALGLGLGVLFWKKMPLRQGHWLGGTVLGVVNYFSVYFLLKSLAAFNNDGAFVYPNFNIAVIVLSSILAVLLFKERLRLRNKIGIFVAVLAIFLVSYQQILAYFIQN